MIIGNFRVELLETGSFGLDGGAMFGVVPKNLWSRAYDSGDEQNRIPMSARALLIVTPERRILVDTGNGHKYDAKFASIYKIDNSQHTLAASLRVHGLAAADITDVILTHLHFDHAGGATAERNGRLEATFSNARYFVQREQLDWARHATLKDRASFVPDNYEPLVAAGLLETLDGAGELFEGIEVIPVHGHTRALQMVKVRADDATLLFCSDLCPTSAHLRVPFVMGYDNYPLTSIEEKERFWPQAYEEQWMICFQHDAFMQAAFIAAGPKGFQTGEPVSLSTV